MEPKKTVFLRKEIAETLKKDPRTINRYINLAYKCVLDFQKSSVPYWDKTNDLGSSQKAHPRVPLNYYQFWVVELISFNYERLPNGVSKKDIVRNHIRLNPDLYSIKAFQEYMELHKAPPLRVTGR